jgi:hypothetical protein
MSVTHQPTEAIEIFYSYAREDEELCKELEKHLSILKRQGVIAGWHDRKISPGKEWEEEIDTHLNTARIILLLISADFMDSRAFGNSSTVMIVRAPQRVGVEAQVAHNAGQQAQRPE